MISWSFSPPFYSLAYAAECLSTSLSTIKRLLSKGDLPYVRVGARRKIPRSGLQAYLICTKAGIPLPPPKSTGNSQDSER
jgi:excisionase family DNA binding protein